MCICKLVVVGEGWDKNKDQVAASLELVPSIETNSYIDNKEAMLVSSVLLR